MQKEPNEIVKYAVLEIARYINQDKNDPQAALTKVSRELDLNVNFIKRASEGINVALHYNHFKKNAEAKDVDFPITDAAITIKDIFGNKEKTADEFKSLEFPSIEENRIDFNKVLTNPNYKKAYLEILNTDAKNEYFETSFKGICEKSANYISKLEKQVEHLQTEKVGASIKIDRLFSDIVGEFSKEAAARVSFDEFESQVFSNHGESQIPYIDFIYKTAKISESRGVHDASYKLFADSKLTKKYGEFVKAKQDLTTVELSLKEAEENLAYEKNFVKEAYAAYGASKIAVSSEVIEDLKKNELIETDDPVLKQAQQKMASEEEGGKSKGGLGILNPVIGAIRGGGKPVSESHLDSLDRKLMLQNLMTTDPIISKMHPQHVASGYEQMLRLAPELSKEKEVVRSTLRLIGSTQAMTPFDAQQLTNANTDLMKQRMMERGDVPPKV